MLMLMARFQACIPDTVRLYNAEQGCQTDAAWAQLVLTWLLKKRIVCATTETPKIAANMLSLHRGSVIVQLNNGQSVDKSIKP